MTDKNKNICHKCGYIITYQDISIEYENKILCGDCYYSNNINRNVLFSEDKRHHYRNEKQWRELSIEVNGKLADKYKLRECPKPFSHNVDMKWHNIPPFE